MNASQTPQDSPKPFVFSSPEGYTLYHRILKEHIQYEPHDVQIEGICKVLDNVDLFAILATRSTARRPLEGLTAFLASHTNCRSTA
jgi:hypothetical protein